MFVVMGILYFVVDLAAVLLLAACWQRTRITGFAIVAASFVAGILGRWLVPLVYRAVDSSDPGMLSMAGWLSQGIFLLVALVAVAGFWDIHRALKQRPVA